MWIEERFALNVGSWQAHPGVGLLHGRYRRAGWTEDGADGLALTAPAQTFDSTQAEGSLSVDRKTGRFRPYATASYRRELGSRQTGATLAFSPLPAERFVVDGTPLPRDTLAGRAGWTLGIGNVDLSLAYQAQRARRQLRQSIELAFAFQ
jgi:hypothetical protein